MSNQQSFRDANPMQLDMGEVYNLRTGKYLDEATARQAADSLRSGRFEGRGCGPIWYEYSDGSRVLARVQRREGTNLRDFRLMVALKLKAEWIMDREYRQRNRGPIG
jgi:hypothetical protein